MIHGNYVKLAIKAIAISVILLTTSVPYASDDLFYRDFGHIYKLKSNAVSLNDGFYPYSPTVKVYNLEGKKISTNNLKVGQYVVLTLQATKNGGAIVDTIQRLPEPGKQAQ